MKKISSVLTVLAKDRPGIIAKVTEALFRENCNLEDISMTVLEGELAMIMVVSLRERARPRLEKVFLSLQKKQGLDFFWKDLNRKNLPGVSPVKGAKTFLISAIGRDRTGIVYKISRVLAGFHVNITDLNSKILGKGAKTLYAMVLEADVPTGLKISKLEKALKQLARVLKIEITLRPFERVEF